MLTENKKRIRGKRINFIMPKVAHISGNLATDPFFHFNLNGHHPTHSVPIFLRQQTFEKKILH